MTDSPAAHTYGLVLVTAPSQIEATHLAKTLVQEKLVACANLIPVTSLYIWEEQLNQDQEWQLILKTQMDRYPALEARILALHPYDVPEIIALPLAAGSSTYLHWISTQVAAP